MYGCRTLYHNRTSYDSSSDWRAAVALADRRGVDALSMRTLATELGAGAMSLYHYIANEEDLLDGLVDLVFAEITLPGTDGDWRGAMRQRALDALDALEALRTGSVR